MRFIRLSSTTRTCPARVRGRGAAGVARVPLGELAHGDATSAARAVAERGHDPVELGARRRGLGVGAVERLARAGLLLERAGDLGQRASRPRRGCCP